MGSSQKEKRWQVKTFRRALNMELREHKSSFIVFSILRFLVLVTMVRLAVRHNYESLFLCVLTLGLLYVPSWVQVRLRIELPPTMEITILCFIFAAEILGEINAFFVVIPYWDVLLHTLNGFLAAAVGFSLAALLNENPKLTFDLSPFFLALVGFCFSMSIGVLWEFFEYFVDSCLHMDMQKDTIVHAVYSVALDPTRTNTVVSVTGITDVAVNDESLGLGGYLDIGLIDTMEDLLVNFVGAVTFSVLGFLYARGKGKRDRAAESFVPRQKTAAQDYLKKTREEDEKPD